MRTEWRGLDKFFVALSGIALAVGGASFGYVLATEGRLSKLEVQVGSLTAIEQAISKLSAIERHMSDTDRRLYDLEHGVTTPMATATRERFSAHDHRLRRLETDLQELGRTQRDILDRMPKRGGAVLPETGEALGG